MIGELVRKVIILNSLELTKSKQNILENFCNEYLKVLAKTCVQLQNADSTYELHNLTYSDIRKTSFLPSDIVQEARKDIWKMHTVLENRHYGGHFSFKCASIRLNKRWFKYILTKRENPCFKITYAPKKKFVIPIAKDRQFQRFYSYTNDGWMFYNVTLLSSGKIAVVLEKEFVKSEPINRYVVGVDIGSSTFATFTVYDSIKDKIVKQLYLGRDVAVRQKQFSIRRAKLQSKADLGSRQAMKSIRRLSRSQSNFVKTRSGQIAKQIINIALKYNAYIAIEKLKNLRAEKGKMNKSARTKINRIPYSQLIEFLKSNSEMFSIPLIEVDPYHTSKWCPNCGAINNGHDSKNYAIYNCGCGLNMNSDRKASLAVAIKSVLVRNQTHKLTICSSDLITRARGSVNNLFRPHDVGLNQAIA